MDCKEITRVMTRYHPYSCPCSPPQFHVTCKYQLESKALYFQFAWLAWPPPVAKSRVLTLMRKTPSTVRLIWGRRIPIPRPVYRPPLGSNSAPALLHAAARRSGRISTLVSPSYSGRPRIPSTKREQLLIAMASPGCASTSARDAGSRQ